MVESPELRWSFIRTIYTIISIQLLLTVAVSAVFISFRDSVSQFAFSSALNFCVSACLIVFPPSFLWPLFCFRYRHPMNLLLLGLFTLTVSLSTGLACAMTSGEIILVAAILTSVVVLSFTLYTFWAAKRGHDFTFLGPLLLAALIILLLFGHIRIVHPMGRVTTMIYGGLSVLVFSIYIIYSTDELIKRFKYEEYVWAAVGMYLNFINLFMSLVTILTHSC
ncbi:BI1-like protein [Apostasia shenzhenica]|uniref:BI1-like protein n=1 Tax=Apostasia shenzhenica TaxID=1088818 RepID=A0A2I0ARW9_9ASPA|nr:BI1-like protein [Apostasia shenzhenica]